MQQTSQIRVVVKIDLTLWSALKLRLAGLSAFRRKTSIEAMVEEKNRKAERDGPRGAAVL